MAVIEEVLALVDRFTAPFTKYISLAGQAAGAASGARQAAERLGGVDLSGVSSGMENTSSAAQEAAAAMSRAAQEAESARSFTASAFSGKAEEARAYAQELLSVQGQLQRLHVELSAHQRMLSAVSGAQGSASSEAAELASRLSGLSAETAALKDRQSALRSALEDAAGGSRKADRALRQYRRAAGTAASSTSALATQVKRLAGAFLGLQGAKALIGQADAMSQITARLNMMNDGLQTTERLHEMIFQSAQRSRGAYGDTAAFVAKLGALAKDAFSSNAELIAFAEQINKQMTLSGTSPAEASGAMLQLTQAMSSGVLRGEELNSVLEQTPMIAQTIARYMGLTTGEMRELAAEGKITARVVKEAMLWAAEETNAAFDSMPVTWGQLAVSAQNILLRGFRPLLDVISSIPQAIIDHSDMALAALLGVGAVLAAVGTAAMISGAKTAAAFLLPHLPLLLLGAAVSAFAYGMLSAGHTASEVLEAVGAGFGWLYALVGNIVVNLYNLWVSFAEFFANVFDHPLQAAGNLFADFIDFVLGLLETAAGAIDTVFGSNLAGAVNGWRANLSQWVRDAIGPNEIQLQRMEMIDFNAAMTDFGDFGRSFGETLAGFGSAAGEVSASGLLPDNQLPDIAKDVRKIARSVSLSEEDIRSLVDAAERRYVNHINLTAQTPVINVSGANTGNTPQDRRALANAIRDILLEQAAAGSARSTARAY